MAGGRAPQRDALHLQRRGGLRARRCRRCCCRFAARRRLREVLGNIGSVPRVLGATPAVPVRPAGAGEGRVTSPVLGSRPSPVQPTGSQPASQQSAGVRALPRACPTRAVPMRHPHVQAEVVRRVAVVHVVVPHSVQRGRGAAAAQQQRGEGLHRGDEGRNLVPGVPACGVWREHSVACASAWGAGRRRLGSLCSLARLERPPLPCQRGQELAERAHPIRNAPNQARLEANAAHPRG